MGLFFVFIYIVEESMLIDLHTHTTASDGQYNPVEIARKAYQKGIELLAITDHDTVKGIEIAKKEEKLFKNIFPGIEISTQDSEEIHILGYGIDITNKELLKACEDFQKERDNRGERIASYLHTKGIEIELECVKKYAKNGVLGRQHFARYLVDNGIVQSTRDAFLVYLDTPEFREQTDRKKPSCETTINLIHKAKGKAVLAHPGIYRMADDKLEKLVGRLTYAELDGIECFYSRHTKLQTERYLELMRKYNLKTSCGSDFHGEIVKPDISLGMKFDYDRYSKDLITNFL